MLGKTLNYSIWYILCLQIEKYIYIYRIEFVD